MTDFAGISEETLAFLADLEEHNDNEWFQANKKRYDAAFMTPAKAVVVALGGRLQEISEGIHAEPKVNGSIFRINRDVRFSKDKTPYKPHMDLMFWQGAGRGREQAAYFFRLTPSTLFLGAGKHVFSKEELSRYRDAVDGDAGVSLVGIMQALQEGGYRTEGLHYKRIPKGYAQDHPCGELLQYNGLSGWIELPITPELSTPAFTELCFGHYQAISPLQEWLMAHVM